ncbi:Regulator of telomere elongation helicase 1 [Cichlidogyrus casuarinus]|uniref:Regulator of telomere elongation helicase 1 homolog n=1 Tax=Cichlidogyrus casuarinus TaxID=1844966 RepID=A0ABD2Q2G8_9PLAT
MCRARVSKRTCSYYKSFEVNRAGLLEQMRTQGAMDIEDLAAEGRKSGCCPFYMSRDLIEDAELFFMPYNYLLDKKSRLSNGIQLENAVIIFDEAHNIEQVCEESSSVALTQSTISSAIEELRIVGTKFYKSQIEDSDQTDQDFDEPAAPFRDNFGTFKENENTEEEDPVKKLNVFQLIRLKSQLLELEKGLSSIEGLGSCGITHKGDFVFELLGQSEIDNCSLPQAMKTVDLVAEIVATYSDPSLLNFSEMDLKRTRGLDSLSDFLRTVFEYGDFGGGEHKLGGLVVQESRKTQQELQLLAARYFRVHIRDETIGAQGSSVWDRSGPKKDRVLSFWCLNPGRAMRDLFRLRIRCVILTSGTLYPLESLKTELNVDFSITLQNNHVINPKDQVQVLVLTRGPDECVLNSSYENRESPAYQRSLGLTMIDLAKHVPRGLLIFFPSYAMMNKMVQFWQEVGIFDSLVAEKKVFVEPRDKTLFAKTLVDYKLACLDCNLRNGACLMAVMRGRASEGLDLSDHTGRAVAILGLPFPPVQDTRVQLKMSYLDEKHLELAKNKPSEEAHISGRLWYKLQAWRAINQAVGRVIRHHRDYGAVVLCDQRFASAEARASLPSWMRGEVQIIDQVCANSSFLPGFMCTGCHDN